MYKKSVIEYYSLKVQVKSIFIIKSILVIFDVQMFYIDNILSIKTLIVFFFMSTFHYFKLSKLVSTTEKLVMLHLFNFLLLFMAIYILRSSFAFLDLSSILFFTSIMKFFFPWTNLMNQHIMFVCTLKHFKWNKWFVFVNKFSETFFYRLNKWLENAITRRIFF